MLVKTALVLLGFWVAGLSGVYAVGDLLHGLLLIALMLLLLGFVRARDAAGRRGVDTGER